MAASEFDRATEVEAIGDGRFTGAVHDGWHIGGNANGGYLLAIAARAMAAHAERPHPISLTAHYLTPAPAGPADLTAEVVKSGRRFATVAGSLQQGGTERIRVLGTFGDLSAPPAAPQLIRAVPPELPSYEDCIGRPPANGPVEVAINARLDVRLHPDDAGFHEGRRSGIPRQRGWFAFADGRPIDPLALLLACDAFPPTVFHLDLPAGWVPTIELTVHVRGIPAPGPIRCVFETRFLADGFFEEDGEMWDSAGRLVAQSRQLALAPRDSVSAG